MFPFKEKVIEKQVVLRRFSQDVSEDELVWHRDREDRIIVAEEFTDWLIQFDNELPQSLNEEVFIPKGVYHRIIKGSGNVMLKVVKMS